MLEDVLLVVGLLMATGVAASLLAGRLRMPSLLLFLALGIVIGPGGLDIAKFNDVGLIHDLGIFALVLILFEGGLASGIDQIKPVWKPAATLASVGVLTTAAVVGILSHLLLGLSLADGLLLGAIVSSTDGAAIFAMLRGSTLRRRLARSLEGEAGLNDPVAALLVSGLVAARTGADTSALQTAGEIVLKLLIDAVVGLLLGTLAAQLFSRFKLSSEGMYPVASLATAILAFGLAVNAHGSGLLAAYVAGMMLGSSPAANKRSILAFHDGIAWVAQLAMFISLGLLVTPSEIAAVWWQGLVVTAVLLFVARPLAVICSLGIFGFSRSELTAISWAGLRGAVPIVFATYPILAGLENAQKMMALVFFVVLASTALQGVTFEGFASRLGVTTSIPAVQPKLIEVASIRRLGADVIEVPVAQDDAIVGSRIKDLGLPREALVNVIVRGDEALLPRGSTQLQVGDRLHVLVRREAAAEMPGLLDHWKAGPIAKAVRPSRKYVSIAPIFVTGPWDSADGDPGYPHTVVGVQVIERLLPRHDKPGALVVLADGRYAVSGEIAIVGSRQAVQRHASKLLSRTSPGSEAAWLQDVVGGCGG